MNSREDCGVGARAIQNAQVSCQTMGTMRQITVTASVFAPVVANGSCTAKSGFPLAQLLRKVSGAWGNDGNPQQMLPSIGNSTTNFSRPVADNGPYKANVHAEWTCTITQDGTPEQAQTGNQCP